MSKQYPRLSEQMIFNPRKIERSKVQAYNRHRTIGHATTSKQHNQSISERTFGIVVFVASSNQEAIELMQNDPAVSRGIMVAELFPYRVALWSPKGPPGDEN